MNGKQGEFGRWSLVTWCVGYLVCWLLGALVIRHSLEGA
jgi:hypothetical protein